jgi:hypothetical protein
MLCDMTRSGALAEPTTRLAREPWMGALQCARVGTLSSEPSSLEDQPVRLGTSAAGDWPVVTEIRSVCHYLPTGRTEVVGRLLPLGLASPIEIAGAHMFGSRVVLSWRRHEVIVAGLAHGLPALDGASYGVCASMTQ